MGDTEKSIAKEIKRRICNVALDSWENGIHIFTESLSQDASIMNNRMRETMLTAREKYLDSMLRTLRYCERNDVHIMGRSELTQTLYEFLSSCDALDCHVRRCCSRTTLSA